MVVELAESTRTTPGPSDISRIDPVDSDDPHNGTRRSSGSDRLTLPKLAMEIDQIWRTPWRRIGDVFLID